MKKFLKPLAGALALTLVLSSAPTITANAAIDPFLTSQKEPEAYVDANGYVVPPETIVEKSNHIPQRVDLTPEQIQGLVASTLLVEPSIDENYNQYGYVEDVLVCQPMYYGCTHSRTESVNPYFYTNMCEKVNYLGDYTIGGVVDTTKLIYEARVDSCYSDAGNELNRQLKKGLITYDQWKATMGTSSNTLHYQAFYRTTYNYAIIVNGQNSPTFNVGTNILAIISPLGDRMYFDVFGLDANGNVYIPDGYHYYNSLLNISYQEYKHKLGICKCTEKATFINESAATAQLRINNKLMNYPNATEWELNTKCVYETLFLKYHKHDATNLDAILQKINGKRYTPVVIK